LEKRMKKNKILLGSVVLSTHLVIAGGTVAPISTEDKQVITAPLYTKAPYKYVKKPITADDGEIHGYIRMHHIFSGEDNGYDPLTGSTLGFGLGYGMEVLSGLKVGVEAYGVMDSGLTDTDESAIAYGQFMNEIKLPSELDAGGAWGVHIRYEMEGVFKAMVGRSQFDSPMTKIQITHVPNLYEYARLDGKILGGNASASFITKMAYGSRSAADFGLIGEYTGTAGMQLSPLTPTIDGKPPITRGEFYSIDETVSAENDSSGIFVLGYEKKIKKAKLKLWNFYVDDIANNLFVEADYKIPLGKGKAVKISAQVWNQDVSNETLEANYGGTMVGAEAVLKWGQVTGKLAYSTKDEGGLLNAWGSNPGYTSSIFSRNEYRSNVDAYKATLVYKPLKNLKLMLSHAEYGKSDMFNKKFDTAPMSDAKETDIAIVYKPWKQFSLKLFNANRTSEYSTPTKERTQNHTRLIMNYAF
jgi:hypothetical protein